MPAKPSMSRKIGLLSSIGNLAKDENGSVAIWFTLVLVVIMGMVGLALDGGAYYHLNSDLQELADAAAVAGAAELDGAGDAITRATDKAENLLSNDPHWSNVARSGLQIATPTFYSALDPTGDPAGDTPTTDPARAKFIKVNTVSREVAPSFLAALGGTNEQTSASAVAGSSYVACNVQPLMLCNPNEQPGGGGTDFSPTPGQMFVFTPKNGGSTTYAPGDFGLVDPPGVNSSGANTTRNLLSQTTANFCYVNNLSPRPGNLAQKVKDGINVRFDMAPNGAGNQAGLDKSPAPNVIKGNHNNVCGNFTPVTAERLPRDTGMTATAGVQIGNGNMGGTAAKNAYWAGHHGVGTTWPTGLTTRYAAYQQELGMAASSFVGEQRLRSPTCNGVAAGVDPRRLISVAVVNCLAQDVRGNQNTTLLSAKYAEFFITEPATDPPDTAIYTEFVRMITPQSESTKLHHVVQLYR